MFSSKDIRDLEKWANGLTNLDPFLALEAQDLVRSMKEGLRGDRVTKDIDKLNAMAKRLEDRTPAPKLTPEQLNAIDLLILGKTDREVSEIVGVRRETVTKWHKNPFFIAELNIKREELWTDSKLRLKALAHEAVNTLTNGLHSSDEKIAITAAVHILKVTGLYDGEWKGSTSGPKTPEEAVWVQLNDTKSKVYRGIRPDAYTDYSTREFTNGLAKDDTTWMIDCAYENAVEEQKKELREYKKKLKSQEILELEPVPLVIEPEPPKVEEIST